MADMLGKEKCKMLREIRRRIADENDIPYVTQDCKHQGNCRGTCPKCESELRDLERQLAARQAMGKRVTVAALCAGLAFASVGCTRGSSGPMEEELGGAVPYDNPAPTPEVFQTEGEIAWPEETEEPQEWVTTGMVAYETEPPTDSELAGEPLPEDFGNG